MTRIDPTARIDPKAQVHETAQIGFNCLIGPNVTIGPDCVLHNNVTIVGRTAIGRGNQFFQNVVIGTVPQDLKYKGEDTQVIIGDGNVFRENVTMHLGTELGGGKTTLANQCLVMAGVHIAHDCHVGDRVLVANNALIGGHVVLESSVVVGGGAAIHHLVTVGRNAMVGGLTRVVYDVPPFMIFEGNPGSIRGVNTTGLGRNGFDDRQIDAIKEAYRKLFRKRQALPALEELEKSNGTDPNVRYLIDFMRRSYLGKHGRHLESCRTDQAADLKNYYKDIK
ncbi:MAG: acyl-ACP--UDP-N-acetylglucosamine O-acyltransferase [Phycisphaerae bacterium]|nr:acyl-ACP--UDP-N-acetylglucosamine O-acyltransferase [Phycisphaerae bacterium]